MTTLTKRVIKRAAQVVVFTGAGWYLARTAHTHWQTLTQLPQALDWVPLVAASAVWLASYAGLIALWARSLAWWDARLRALAALRVFLLANLARYIPGAVWQFAGLAALAVEEGISPAAATIAVLLQQVVLLATGLTLALAFAPAFMRPYASAGSPVVAFLVSATGLAALMIGFPVVLPALKRYLERLTKRALPLPHASARSFALYVAGSGVGWLGYGVSFWLFARALFGPQAPGLVTAGSAFVASYVAGIIAVFAPGGLIVREAALVVALGPELGGSRAFLLAVASRLWLTALEILGAGAVLAAGAGRRGAPGQGLRSSNTN